jgi:hypothetical protein
LGGQTHIGDDKEHAPLFAISRRVVQPWPVSEAHMAQSQITATHDRRPPMKISARNQLKGKIVAVNAGATIITCQH